MANYTITVTLGTGEKGMQWDKAVRFHARKRKQSIGAFVRSAIHEKITRETGGKTEPTQAAAAPVEQPAPAAGV